MLDTSERRSGCACATSGQLRFTVVGISATEGSDPGPLAEPGDDDALSISMTRDARLSNSTWASDSTHSPTSDADATPTHRSMSSAISRAVA